MEFTKRQQSIILKKAQELGISPKLFLFSKIDAPTNSIINHYDGSEIKISDTEYYFKVSSHDNFKGNFVVKARYSPGNTLHVEATIEGDNQSEFNWDDLDEDIDHWLTSLKEEFNAISEIEKIMAFPDFIHDSSNDQRKTEKFTKEEQKVIIEQIEVLKSKIESDFSLQKDEIRFIHSKLDQLKTDVKTLNKFDFRTLFIGLTINLASSLLYDNAPKWWNLISTLFRGALNLLK